MYKNKYLKYKRKYKNFKKQAEQSNIPNKPLPGPYGPHPHSPPLLRPGIPLPGPGMPLLRPGMPLPGPGMPLRLRGPPLLGIPLPSPLSPRLCRYGAACDCPNCKFTHPPGHNIVVKPVVSTRNTPQIHDSAGVLLIHINYNHHGDVVILGKGLSGKLELFYGKSNSGETREQTAAREALEETGCLFKFTGLNIKESVASPDGHHTAFVVRVTGECNTKLFYDNLKQLRLMHAGDSWMETTDLVRISIQNLKNSRILTKNLSNDFSVVDVEGKQYTIFSRDAEFIKSAINNGLATNAHVSNLTRRFANDLHTYEVQ